MTPEDATALVAECLRPIAPEAELSVAAGDAVLADELDLDSMDLVSLYQALHERTGLELPERDYGELATLDGLVAYLVARLP